MADPSVRQMRLTDAESTLKKIVEEMREDIFSRLVKSDTSHDALLVIKGEAKACSKLIERFRAEQNKP